MPKRPRCGSGMPSYNEKRKSKQNVVCLCCIFYVLSVCRVLISLIDKISVDIWNVLRE